MKISKFGNLLSFEEGYEVNDVKNLIKKHHLNGLEVIALLKSDQKKLSILLKDLSFLKCLRIVSNFEFDYSWIKDLKSFIQKIQSQSN